MAAKGGLIADITPGDCVELLDVCRQVFTSPTQANRHSPFLLPAPAHGRDLPARRPAHSPDDQPQVRRAAQPPDSSSRSVTQPENGQRTSARRTMSPGSRLAIGMALLRRATPGAEVDESLVVLGAEQFLTTALSDQRRAKR